MATEPSQTNVPSIIYMLKTLCNTSVLMLPNVLYKIPPIGTIHRLSDDSPLRGVREHDRSPTRAEMQKKRDLTVILTA